MYYAGVDISKEKLDVAVKDGEGNVVEQVVITNKPAHIKRWLKKFFKQYGASAEELVICCENTGIYSNPLQSSCTELQVPLWVEHAYRISKASHDLRGKSDAQDAVRIADYCLRYKDRFQPFSPVDEEVEELQELNAVRDDLMKRKNQLMNQLREAKEFAPKRYKTLKKHLGPMIKIAEHQLKKVNEEIKALIEQNEKLNKNIKLICSVPGVGLQNAIAIVVVTDNFARFKSAKHLACYAGVVPFPNQSGRVIKRDRVSRHSNRNLKRLLHMAAMAMIRCDDEIKAYFERKVEQGKHKMSIINAVRNKIVHRIWAVVQRQEPYVKMN